MRILVVCAALLAATSASAHVTAWPKASAPGVREKYEFRVPNEKQSETIAIELRFPADVKVVSFEQKTGWNTELMRDAGGALIGVRWSGRLQPMQFTEFGLIAANPQKAGELIWSATQFYADGTKIEWSGPPESKTPAPRVTLTPRTPAP